MKDIFSELSQIFDKSEKRKFLLLAVLMLIGAIAEMMGISLIIPFFSIINDPSIIQKQAILLWIYQTIGIKSPNSFLILCSIALLLAYIIKNVYLIFYYIYQNKLVFKHQAILSKRLLNEYLSKPYTFHLQRNSAELLRNVNTEVSQLITGVILPSLSILSEALVAMCVLILLLFVDLYVTLVAVTFLATSSIIFLKIFKQKIDIAGKEQQYRGVQTFKWVTQSINAIKEVKILGREKFFLKKFDEQMTEYSKSLSYSSTLIQMPRLFIESMSVICIIFVVGMVIIQGKDIKLIASLLAVFGLSAVRLMPSMNRILGGITTIRYYKPTVEIIYRDLVSDDFLKSISHTKLVKHEQRIPELRFKNQIELINVSFRYPNATEDVIKNINFNIPIGKSVALVGTSGAGKTTLVDVILGLLRATEGKILVDGMDIYSDISFWQGIIGYVPQTTYLSDDSIRKNVAFGIDDKFIDDDKVWNAIKAAQLESFITSLSDGLNNVVGERGVRLSGGQRQRIGIARALYNNPEILVLDEATSSVDNETERDIMKSIDMLKGKKTLIIIAHRLSTIQNCDIIYKVKNGKVEKPK